MSWVSLSPPSPWMLIYLHHLSLILKSYRWLHTTRSLFIQSSPTLPNHITSTNESIHSNIYGKLYLSSSRNFTHLFSSYTLYLEACFLVALIYTWYLNYVADYGYSFHLSGHFGLLRILIRQFSSTCTHACMPIKCILNIK